MMSFREGSWHLPVLLRASGSVFGNMNLQSSDVASVRNDSVAQHSGGILQHRETREDSSISKLRRRLQLLPFLVRVAGPQLGTSMALAVVHALLSLRLRQLKVKYLLRKTSTLAGLGAMAAEALTLCAALTTVESLLARFDLYPPSGPLRSSATPKEEEKEKQEPLLLPSSTGGLLCTLSTGAADTVLYARRALQCTRQQQLTAKPRAPLLGITEMFVGALDQWTNTARTSPSRQQQQQQHCSSSARAAADALGLLLSHAAPVVAADVASRTLLFRGGSRPKQLPSGFWQQESVAAVLGAAAACFAAGQAASSLFQLSEEAAASLQLPLGAGGLLEGKGSAAAGAEEEEEKEEEEEETGQMRTDEQKLEGGGSGECGVLCLDPSLVINSVGDERGGIAESRSSCSSLPSEDSVRIKSEDDEDIDSEDADAGSSSGCCTPKQARLPVGLEAWSDGLLSPAFGAAAAEPLAPEEAGDALTRPLTRRQQLLSEIQQQQQQPDWLCFSSDDGHDSSLKQQQQQPRQQLRLDEGADQATPPPSSFNPYRYRSARGLAGVPGGSACTRLTPPARLMSLKHISGRSKAIGSRRNSHEAAQEGGR